MCIYKLNSDGAPIANSTMALWPILGSILELEQSVRESFENLLIFGKHYITVLLKH